MPFWRHRPLKLVIAAAIVCTASAAHADSVVVPLDQARLVKLPDRVSSIVIGNPAIADASLQAGGMLVVTGKGYGATNMLALDRQGRVVMDKTVQVTGPAPGDTMVVYRGNDRETYSCTPECMPRLTLGDTPAYFSAVGNESAQRNGFAAAGGNAPSK